MVDLVDLLPAVRTVALGKGEVEVYGLQLGELVPLLTEHEEVITALFSKAKPDFKALVVAAPELVMQLIAAALNTKDMPSVRRIPLAKQLEILMVMWEVTVPDPKEFAAKLAELLAMVQQLKA